MKRDADDLFEARLEEIEQKIREFRRQLQEGTKSESEFITMSEIESLWSMLRSDTNNQYSGMIGDLISEADERDMIRLKKGNTGRGV